MTFQRNETPEPMNTSITALTPAIIQTRVIKIISEQVGVDESQIKPVNSIAADFGADSLDLVEIIMALEDEFGLQLPDDDCEKVVTVADAVALIEKYRA